MSGSNNHGRFNFNDIVVKSGVDFSFRGVVVGVIPVDNQDEFFQMFADHFGYEILNRMLDYFEKIDSEYRSYPMYIVQPEKSSIKGDVIEGQLDKSGLKRMIGAAAFVAIDSQLLPDFKDL